MGNKLLWNFSFKKSWGTISIPQIRDKNKYHNLEHVRCSWLESHCTYVSMHSQCMFLLTYAPCTGNSALLARNFYDDIMVDFTSPLIILRFFSIKAGKLLETKRLRGQQLSMYSYTCCKLLGTALLYWPLNCSYFTILSYIYRLSYRCQMHALCLLHQHFTHTS